MRPRLAWGFVIRIVVVNVKNYFATMIFHQGVHDGNILFHGERESRAEDARRIYCRNKGRHQNSETSKLRDQHFQSVRGVDILLVGRKKAISMGGWTYRFSPMLISAAIKINASKRTIQLENETPKSVTCRTSQSSIASSNTNGGQSRRLARQLTASLRKAERSVWRGSRHRFWRPRSRFRSAPISRNFGAERNFA